MRKSTTNVCTEPQTHRSTHKYTRQQATRSRESYSASIKVSITSTSSGMSSSPASLDATVALFGKGRKSLTKHNFTKAVEFSPVLRRRLSSSLDATASLRSS